MVLRGKYDELIKRAGGREQQLQTKGMTPAKPITPDQKGGIGREWLTKEGRIADQRGYRGTQQPTKC